MSIASSARRRRSLATGVALLGCSLAAATRSDAGIVDLDLGPGGFNILGVNAGVASGTYRDVNNFPVAGPRLQVYNSYGSSGYCGLDGDFGLEFAIIGGIASPRNFASGASIDGSATWHEDSMYTAFRYASSVSANFGPGSFMGFRFTTDSGSNWNYGWLEVTWDGTDWEIMAASYESIAGTAILAGATGGGGGVPLPGAAGLGACGLLGLGRRRRR